MRKTPESTASVASGTRYVDSPKGQFRWCFPFSPTTEKLATDLARKGAATEQVLRACIGEVKRKEQKVTATMANYARIYDDKVAEAAGRAPQPQGPLPAEASPKTEPASPDTNKAASPPPSRSAKNGVAGPPQAPGSDGGSDEDVDLDTVDLSAVEALIAEARRMKVS